MKIIRWVSCHLILLIVLVSLAVGWYFRSDLASDYTRLTGAAVAAVASTDDGEKMDPVHELIDNTESSALPQIPASGTTTMEMSAAQDAVPGGMREPAIESHPQGEWQPPATDRQEAQKQASVPMDVQAWSRVADAPDVRDEVETASEAPPIYPGDTPAPLPVLTEDLPETSSTTPEALYPPDDYDPELEKSMPDASQNIVRQSRKEPLPGMQVNTEMQADFPHQLPANDGRVPGGFDQPAWQDNGQPGDPSFAAEQLQAQGGEYQSLLESARRLYWGGELDAARQEYEKLVLNYPDRPEPASELGNLLMQQNLGKEAARAYEAAIANFRRLRRDDEAIGLIRFISRYNTGLADTLYNKYWQ